MALIDRTIYPIINKEISEIELLNNYTPSNKEIQFAYKHVKGINQLATFLILLKIFKQFNYFPKYELIPNRIINHINKSFELDIEESLSISEKTLYKYKNIIKYELNIKDDIDYIKKLSIKTVEDFEPIMENPADVFNAVIEVLVKNNCELPSFNTLERLINNKRAEINNNIFNDIEIRLTEYDKGSLNLMLETDDNGKSTFNYIKELPKSPTLNNMKLVMENYIYILIT
ncbi:MAG: DUF4158 domain-containing protein [Clostridium sp.]